MASKKDQPGATSGTNSTNTDVPAAPPAPAPAGGILARVGAAGRKPLAKIGGNEFAIVSMAEGGAGNDIRTALAENLGGAKLSAFDFQRIRVPAGGGLAWTMLNPETGEETPETMFEGIIVAFSDQKAYWKMGLDEAGAVQGPPNCHSTDCVQGRGDPGVLCAQCVFNQFGTAKKGTARGKACKDVRLLFVCRQGDILPELLPIPPTSLKGVRDYFVALAIRGIPYWRAVTRFRLSSDKNSAGVKYAKVVCEPVGALGDETAGAVKAYSALVRDMLGQAPVLALKAADFNNETGEVVEGSATDRGEDNGADGTDGAAEGEENRAGAVL